MVLTPSVGTLKLLVEDVVSALRKEGRRQLTFGYAPFCNLNDGCVFRRHIPLMYWMSLYMYNFANNV